MKLVHCIHSWFTEIVFVKQYFLLSDFVLTSFHSIMCFVRYGEACHKTTCIERPPVYSDHCRLLHGLPQ